MNAATIRKASWAKVPARARLSASAATAPQHSSMSSVARVLTVSVLSGLSEFCPRISQ
ncbi:hypothetical protein SCALM49S_06460 [Streptomyces californicus]